MVDFLNFIWLSNFFEWAGKELISKVRNLFSPAIKIQLINNEEDTWTLKIYNKLMEIIVIDQVLILRKNSIKKFKDMRIVVDLWQTPREIQQWNSWEFSISRRYNVKEIDVIKVILWNWKTQTKNIYKRRSF